MLVLPEAAGPSDPPVRHRPVNRVPSAAHRASTPPARTASGPTWSSTPGPGTSAPSRTVPRWSWPRPCCGPGSTVPPTFFGHRDDTRRSSPSAALLGVTGGSGVPTPGRRGRSRGAGGGHALVPASRRSARGRPRVGLCLAAVRCLRRDPGRADEGDVGRVPIPRRPLCRVGPRCHHDGVGPGHREHPRPRWAASARRWSPPRIPCPGTPWRR